MSGVFSSEEIDRYARHFVLSEIGGPGQQKLKSARILVLGAGGLGAPVLQYLAAAGVGTLRIVDDDVVSLSNLQRQIIHETSDLGEPKVESAGRTLAAINPHVVVEQKPVRLTEANADELLFGCDLAIDGCDNFDTRYLMADVCEARKVPLITSAVNRFDGTITTLKPWDEDESGKRNPGYRDIFPNKPEDGLVPSCAEAGVLGAMTGLMGSLLALEAIKELVGFGDGLVGRLLMVDGLSLRFQTIAYKRVQN